MDARGSGEFVGNGRRDAMREPTVVIIDDDRAFADALAILLRKRQYRTRVGYCGREGRLLLQTEQADVAVMDIHMPDMCGLDLLAELRLTERLPAVILVSADDSPATAQRCRECGAADFLVKPVSPRQLLACIQTLANRSATRIK